MIRYLIGTVLAAAMLPTFATPVEIDVVPTGWKMENYVGGSPAVVVWYTTATCSNATTGQALIFPSNATTEDQNRFWATVTTAKATQQMMFVRYDDVSCQILSFGVPAS